MLTKAVDQVFYLQLTAQETYFFLLLEEENSLETSCYEGDVKYCYGNGKVRQVILEFWISSQDNGSEGGEGS